MSDPPRTLNDSLAILFEKGLRYSTVIDCGCADGHFYLEYFARGYFAGAMPVNIDANSVYEPSLKAIKDLLGGHYEIAALTDRIGEIELTLGVHPYWSSLQESGDRYWQTMNALHEGTKRVPAITIDALVAKLALRPPFLIKLDVQGDETAVLKGARETLLHTDVIVCESDLADFRAIDRMFDAAGFNLFDLTELRSMRDGSLGWFHPVYLNRRLEHVRRRSFWNAADNAEVIELQKQRREGILAFNADIIAKIKAALAKR